MFRRKRPSTGVILLRMGADPGDRLKAIEEIIKRVKGKFVTVNDGRFKVREF